MSTTSKNSGIDLEELSTTVRPQDDLFRYVNGSWIDQTPIPSDKADYGTFMILFEESERAVRDIVTEASSAPVGSAIRKCADLYASFMDEARIEALGADALRASLARVEVIQSMSEFLATLGELQREGVGTFYNVFVDNDPGNPDRYLAFFEQGGISLPDESYYREEHFAPVRDAFVAHIERMFELAGVSDAASRARRVAQLEGEIARCHWDNVASRDSVKTYNLVSWTAARELFDSGLNPDNSSDDAIDLSLWAQALALGERALDEVVLRQPSFTHDLAGLVNDARREDWKDWLTWRIIQRDAPYLSRAFVDERFDFYGRTLTGAETLRERWKRGLALVEGALGEAVGEQYVERHFPAYAKERMVELVGHLVEAYRQSITTLEWMSDATRQRALEKLDAFRAKVGYPEQWRDYTTLEIDPTDLLANVRAATAFEFARQFAKLGQPVDRSEWFMTPQTINAYYNPGFNEIVFPAAILQPPFFDVTRDDAANYGAIGAVIGHEIGHGFDDQGSKFDGSGRLSDWWEPSDRAAFEQRATALIEQYNELSPRETPGLHVNGALTVGENIGDLGGLGIAWKAYRLSLGDEEPPVIDGLSGAQRFFLAWALAWRSQRRVAEAERRLAIDPHSPAEFRCNQIVRNIEAFYDAFELSRDDALWLDPARRVTIW